MHELAITQSMLNLVLEQAQKAGAKEVKRINLVIGKMSGFAEESVQFYFDLISKGTIAERAVLSFKTIPTTARCQGCGKFFEPKESDWSCPYCQSNSVEIVAGEELQVESIEVE
jgi:hydrogenase nickel incorporation protein HypA/HybF